MKQKKLDKRIKKVAKKFNIPSQKLKTIEFKHDIDPNKKVRIYEGNISPNEFIEAVFRTAKKMGYKNVPEIKE